MTPEEPTQPLLTILTTINKAPSWTKQPGDNQYLGFYQNVHGEKLVFVYDYETETARLWHSDCEHDKLFPVEEAGLREVTLVPGLRSYACGDLTVDPDEFSWLQLCWKTARSGYKFRQEQRQQPEDQP
jgi:hypothetical protein